MNPLIAILISILEPILVKALDSGLSELEASTEAKTGVTAQLETMGLEALIPLIDQATPLLLATYKAGLHTPQVKPVQIGGNPSGGGPAALQAHGG